MSQFDKGKNVLPNHITPKETLDEENQRVILEVEESWGNKLWEQLRKGGSQTSSENSTLIYNLECKSKFSMDMNDLNLPDVRT